jgi:hypothetical protein
VKNMPEGELKHATYDRLTRTNAVLLLIDHQVGLVAGSRYPEPQDLRKNVLGLARASMILGVPIVVTTTMSAGMFGPIFPELANLLKDKEIIDRTTVTRSMNLESLPQSKGLEDPRLLLRALTLQFAPVFLQFQL